MAIKQIHNNILFGTAVAEILASQYYMYVQFSESEEDIVL